MVEIIAASRSHVGNDGVGTSITAPGPLPPLGVENTYSLSLWFMIHPKFTFSVGHGLSLLDGLCH